MRLSFAALLVADPASTAQTDDLFTADRPVEAMLGKQVVFETSRGTFVIEVLPEKAPNHAAFFLLQAEQGYYDGTAFHRVIARGRDRARGRPALEGSGGDRALRDRGGCSGSRANRTTRSMSGARSPRSRSPAGRTAPARSSSW